MNGKNWYSDMGVTPIKKPYPTAFKAVVQAYLSGLVKESSSELASLQKDQQETGERVQSLRQELQQYTADPNADPSQPVDFGSTQIPRDHAIKRTKVMISRTQRRLDILQKQLNAIPQETDCANKLLANFQS
jgi:chromosome segregation ATPase